MVKILAFAGSTRKESFNKKLARIAAEESKKLGAEVTYIDLKDFPLPVYDGDLEAEGGQPENAHKLHTLFLQHSGILLSSPEYNSSYSAVFKNVIDWISRIKTSNAFNGKVVSLLSASPGALGGLRGLVQVRSLLGNLGMIVLPAQFALSGAGEAFNDKGELINSKNTEKVISVVKPLVEISGKLG